MKKRKNILLLVYLVILTQVCASCVDYRPLENPCLVDRTEGWLATIIVKESFNLEELDPSNKSGIGWFLLINSENDISEYKQKSIQSKQEVAKAAKQIIDETYQTSVKLKKLNIKQNYYGNLWLVVYEQYIVVLDLYANPIACTNLENISRAIRINDKNPFFIDIKLDITKMSLDSLLEYGISSNIDMNSYNEYLEKASLIERGKKDRKGRTKVEEVYNKSLSLASKLENYRGYFSNEFRIYDNLNHDAWIVINCRWAAVFSKDTGKLVYLCFTEAFQDDFSIRLF